MTPRYRRIVSLVLFGTLLVIALVLGFPDALQFFNRTTDAADPGIPRSFSGNRVAYGLALFSLFSTSSLAIRKLILIAAQLHSEDWRQDPDVGMYRLALACLLFALVIAAGPDVILLLLWGEVGDKTLTAAMTLDRLCDGLVIIPFTMAIMFHVRAEQFQRTPSHSFFASFKDEEDAPRSRKLFAVVPRRETIAENVKIVIAVMVIAAGLALWK